MHVSPRISVSKRSPPCDPRLALDFPARDARHLECPRHFLPCYTNGLAASTICTLFQTRPVTTLARSTKGRLASRSGHFSLRFAILSDSDDDDG
jgi:hypothetical protein